MERRKKKKTRCHSAATWDEFQDKLKSLCDEKKPQLSRGKPFLERIRTDVHSDETNDSPQDETWADNDNTELGESPRSSGGMSASVQPLVKKKKRKGRKIKKRSKSRRRAFSTRSRRTSL